MLACPHCQSNILMRRLPYRGYTQTFRICPVCGGKFTVDSDTKIRQALFLVVTLIALAFTLLLYFAGSEWLVPAVVSYVAWALLILWGNSQIVLVRHDDRKSSSHDGN
jgi:uncharacterized protein (DUF983 family)